MFEQIDGLLACRDLRCARFCDVRGPGYLYTGSKNALCSSTWPLSTSTWALQPDLWSHETSKRPPWPILERFRTPLGGSRRPKTL